MMIHKSIHPFPARMAPEIAFSITKDLPKNSVLLDPMMGSGTTLQIGIQNNCKCIGCDVDPLALLITKTSLVKPDKNSVDYWLTLVIKKFGRVSDNALKYWDQETSDFVKFWFAKKQSTDLIKLSKSILSIEDEAIRDMFFVAISRCIITKERGASLASDVSHAKPHKTKKKNDFDVLAGFQSAVKHIHHRQHFNAKAKVFLDDARRISNVKDESVDCIITSPPYLHAVDYFRGHRLSLVWLGYTLNDLRTMRANSIGLQKNPKNAEEHILKEVLKKVGKVNLLPEKQKNHLNKYALDINSMCHELNRVLKEQGKATVVIANAWSAGIEINNTRLIKNAASLNGLRIVSEKKRKIPANKRYLPPPEYITNSPLDKRMKTEAVLTFAK